MIHNLFQFLSRMIGSNVPVDCDANVWSSYRSQDLLVQSPIDVCRCEYVLGVTVVHVYERTCLLGGSGEPWSVCLCVCIVF